MKEFFSLAEILEAKAPGLPATRSGISRYVERQGWRSVGLAAGKARKRSGRAGEWEYHISLLPEAAQARMLVIHGLPVDEKKSGTDTASEALWRRFERLSNKQKRTAQQRLEAVIAVRDRRSGGLGETAAVALAANDHGVSGATLFNWLRPVSGKSRADWLAALAAGYRSTARRADCPPEAWAALRSDYLRPERPGFSACYRRVAEAAKRHGWGTLPSERALRRRLEAEVPRAVIIMARDGKDMAKALYPPQRRDRSGLHAMQAFNMDGHEFDVWVTDGKGKPFRPILVAVQDLYSGKLLAWRLARTENRDVVRLVIGNMVERYGVPEKVVLDNGRAFASKMISGGAATRFRPLPARPASRRHWTADQLPRRLRWPRRPGIFSLARA